MQSSITDTQRYRQFCLDAVNNEKKFNNFRRHPLMIKTLEHCSYEFAIRYLENIKTKQPEIYRYLLQGELDDSIGNPKKIKIHKDLEYIGTFSTKTLHYISVFCDLLNNFDLFGGIKICEIGVGYGGQCKIINDWSNPNYTLVDIKPALQLAQKYLDNFILTKVKYKTMNELKSKRYDLVISNYAFSELNIMTQDMYIDKVLLNSDNGYLIYNHTTPQEFNSYTAKELVDIIPNAYIIPEVPLTHPNNCIVIWKEN